MAGGGTKKLLKKILICIVLGVNLGFTRIQFFQHMFLKKTKKEPRVITILFLHNMSYFFSINVIFDVFSIKRYILFILALLKKPDLNLKF
jgi:hypothetical protein